MEMLEKFFPKPETTLNIDHVTIIEVYSTIISINTANSCGFDQISSRTVKMMPEITAMWLTHLINCIIPTQIYPKCMKILKLIPICKPTKLETEMISYRPNNIQNSYEMIIQKLIKRTC